MASQTPPIKGAAFTYEAALVSQADTDIFQAAATLVAGDVLVYSDAAAGSNAANIPTVIGSGKVVTHTLSTTEMDADRVVILYSDQTGDEWQDLIVTIQTAGVLVDDLPTAAEVWTSATRTITARRSLPARLRLGR